MFQRLLKLNINLIDNLIDKRLLNPEYIRTQFCNYTNMTSYRFTLTP